jgi:ribosome maturation protein Sdo1
LLEGASKSTLENEFGTSNEDEAVLKILEKGTLQEFEVCCFLGGELCKW